MEFKKELEDKLKKTGIDYKLISLPPDLPPDVASHVIFHRITMKDAVPTLIYSTEKGMVAIQRRADTKFNIQKVKEFLGVKKLDFANNEELHKLGTGSGIVPLTGLNIPYFMDNKILERGEIYGGSGLKNYALKISAKDLLKINRALAGNLTDTEEIKRVYGGMRATGRLHLGNYLGGAKGMLALQDQYDCIFTVVDLHVLTTPYEHKTLKQSVRNVILDYLSVGLDPKKCKLEIQSQIPEHTELAYLLSTIYPLAPLQDLPTFKEKASQYPKNITVSLLYYPILMAADILLYKGELVPVGIDQEPHLEVAREAARKFNLLYGETFPEPYRFKTMGEYVPSLTGKGKMSKTVEGSFINLSDDLDSIKKKLAKVTTDSGEKGGDIPKEGGIASLFGLLYLFNSDDMYKKFLSDYERGIIRYSDLKNYLAEAIYKELQPIQEKRKYFEDNIEIVNEILAKSRKECQEIARSTMKGVKEKMGLV